MAQNVVQQFRASVLVPWYFIEYDFTKGVNVASKQARMVNLRELRLL